MQLLSYLGWLPLAPNNNDLTHPVVLAHTQVFFFFGGWVLMMTIFVILFVPETRQVPIEEVEEVRIGRHWFWSRIVAGTRPPAKKEPSEIIKVELSQTAEGPRPVLSISKGTPPQFNMGPNAV